MSRNDQIRCILLAGILAARPALGAPSIGAPASSQTSIVVGVPVQLKVTSQITLAPADPPVVANGVNLLRVDGSGQTITILGVMHDDGLNGDAMAGDGIYTLQFTASESAVGQMRLQVSAALRGVLLRAKSPVTTVPVVASATLSISATPTPQPNAAGWNNGNVVVSFTCLGGTGGIAVCPAPILVSTEGANQQISGTAQDGAGNSATGTITLNIDKTAPGVGTAVAPAPNAAGWNNGPVAVTFTCSDTGSGIDQCPAPVPVTADGTQTISGTAKDKAGNAASASVVVKVDKLAPAITATPTPAPNAAGWNQSTVVVNYTCADTGSGIATCPAQSIIVTETSGQSVTGTAIDLAGNSASASATVKVDKTPPVLAITSANGATVTAASQTISGTVTDVLSGVSGVTCAGTAAVVASGTFTCTINLAVGSNSISVAATDAAGNSGTANVQLVYSPAPHITLTSPTNLSYLNISPTTVTGMVDNPAATVVINNVSAPVGNGQFSLSLPLQEGPNLITASATNGAGAVGTASIQVTLDTTPPHVTITSPQDQFTTTDASVSIAGNVNDIVVGTVNDQQAQVTVNGVAAQVANRTFLATNVPLNLGNNIIQAVGRDRAGNAATTQITILRQAPSAQPQIQLLSGNNQTGAIGSALTTPLAVRLLNATGNPAPNQTVLFKVTQNNGLVTAGGAPAASSVAATTDASGQAQAQWTLGTRAGAGGNTVEAYAVGFNGTAIFTATGTQGPAATIVIDTGNNQVGVVNESLPKPLIAVVVDSGSNRLANVPVTFTVKQGGGTFGGQQSMIVNSDSDGRVSAALTLGFQEGNGNNLVEANFPGNTGFPASFTASGRAAGDPANTSISGVVLDNSNLPIPGVTVRAVLTNLLNSNSSSINAAATVQTDAQGQFVILPAPVGYVKLLVDGSTAQRPGKYPTLDYDMVTVSGQANTVGLPIYLLPLNPANQLCVTASTGGGTLTVPEAPGFSLTFSPGQVTFPGGSKDGCVSVTVVHGDKVPMVPGFGQQPRFIVTIQPAGALFNPPAAITLPNVDGLLPRGVTEMYSFDHDIGSFVAIGTGIVSDDGSVIASAPGVGVLKAGWHCGGNPSPGSGSVAHCPECQECVGNECVNKQYTADECCNAITPSDSDPRFTIAGFVGCCNGTAVACLNGNNYPGGGVTENIRRDCAFQHEKTHEGQASCPTDAACPTELTVPANDSKPDECDAYRAQINCLYDDVHRVGASCDQNCLKALQMELNFLTNTANDIWSGCILPGSPPLYQP